MANQSNVSPTRSELLEVKRRISLAHKGHSLLKKKQDYLINEFFKLVKEYKQYKSSIQEEVREVYDELSLDIAYNGIAVSRSVSYSAPESFTMEFTRTNVMGVQIPQMKVEAKKADIHVFENSPLLVDVTMKFRELFAKLIRLSSMKLSLYTMAEEIKKVKRRVNSLEHIQIPKMEGIKDYILFILGEQERENFTRLKMVKARLE